jgi:hypothetical protein
LSLLGAAVPCSAQQPAGNANFEVLPVSHLAQPDVPQPEAAPLTTVPALFDWLRLHPTTQGAPTSVLSATTSLQPQEPTLQPLGPSEGAQTPDPTLPGPSNLNEPAPFDWSKFRLGGQYRIEPNASNFSFHPTTVGDAQPTEGYVLQRFRLWLTYDPTDNVQGYIQMQIGQLPWGTGFDFSKTFQAPNHGDEVGILLRRAWLAVKSEDLGQVRAGILDWHDSFDDTMASSDYDFNVGGVEWTKTIAGMNNLALKAAFLLLNDQAFVDSNLLPGSHTAYLLAWDADQPVGARHSVGFSAYYLRDLGGYSYQGDGPYSSSWDLWVGVRGKLGFETMPISGFFLANTGERTNIDSPNFTHTGWASQVQFGPLQLGPGKLSVQGLFASGGSGGTTGHSNEFRTLAQSFGDNFGAEGYWSYLQLSSPNAPGDVQDLGVSLQNRGFGLGTAQAKYEYPICDRLSGIAAVGWLRTATVNPANGSWNIGTELTNQFTYDFGGGLKLDLGAAVLFTGGYYRDGFTGPTPNNLYEIFSRLQLEF